MCRQLACAVVVLLLPAFGLAAVPSDLVLVNGVSLSTVTTLEIDGFAGTFSVALKLDDPHLVSATVTIMSNDPLLTLEPCGPLTLVRDMPLSIQFSGSRLFALKAAIKVGLLDATVATPEGVTVQRYDTVCATNSETMLFIEPPIEPASSLFCMSSGDPHVNQFDRAPRGERKRAVPVYTVGTYHLVTSNEFEVQAKHTSCGTENVGGTPGACNKAIAVRWMDQVFLLDPQPNGWHYRTFRLKQVTPPMLKVFDANTNQAPATGAGVTVGYNADAGIWTFTMPNNKFIVKVATVSVTTAAKTPDELIGYVQVTIPAYEASTGLTGMCGTPDGNHTNDVTKQEIEEQSKFEVDAGDVLFDCYESSCSTYQGYKIQVATTCADTFCTMDAAITTTPSTPGKAPSTPSTPGNAPSTPGGKGPARRLLSEQNKGVAERLKDILSKKKLRNEETGDAALDASLPKLPNPMPPTLAPERQARLACKAIFSDAQPCLEQAGYLDAFDSCVSDGVLTWRKGVPTSVFTFVQSHFEAFLQQCASALAAEAQVILAVEDNVAGEGNGRMKAPGAALEKLVSDKTPEGAEQRVNMIKAAASGNLLLASKCNGKCKNGGACTLGGCKCKAGFGGLTCQKSIANLAQQL